MRARKKEAEPANGSMYPECAADQNAPRRANCFRLLPAQRRNGLAVFSMAVGRFRGRFNHHPHPAFTKLYPIFSMARCSRIARIPPRRPASSLAAVTARQHWRKKLPDDLTPLPACGERACPRATTRGSDPERCIAQRGIRVRGRHREFEPLEMPPHPARGHAARHLLPARGEKDGHSAASTRAAASRLFKKQYAANATSAPIHR